MLLEHCATLGNSYLDGEVEGVWPVGVQFEMPSHQRSERGHETLKRLLCNNKLFDFQNWEERIN
jgi:hypothetical protein